MTREQCVAIAEVLKWRRWSKGRPYRGSWYQCFRRHNTYAWVGYSYVEVSHSGVALDFLRSSESDVKSFLA